MPRGRKKAEGPTLNFEKESESVFDRLEERKSWLLERLKAGEDYYYDDNGLKVFTFAALQRLFYLLYHPKKVDWRVEFVQLPLPSIKVSLDWEWEGGSWHMEDAAALLYDKPYALEQAITGAFSRILKKAIGINSNPKIELVEEELRAKIERLFPAELVDEIFNKAVAMKEEGAYQTDDEILGRLYYEFKKGEAVSDGE